MATLTVNDLTLEVIGEPSWSVEMPRIQARVRVPPTVQTGDLDSGSATVRLDLGSGGIVAGEGLWRVGDLQVSDDIVTLVFEGSSGSVKREA